jgi:hypothetical protein
MLEHAHRKNEHESDGVLRSGRAATYSAATIMILSRAALSAGMSSSPSG